jgi:tRNA 2-thiouridine synthesizing protein A
MTDETKIDLKLNMEGLLCPIPVVKLSQAIKEVQVGGVIECFATDPGVLADIPAWCKTTGNELITMEREGKGFRFLTKRTV